MAIPTHRDEGSAAPPAETEVVTRTNGLRIFQAVAALVGAAVFLIGLLGVFDVDFDAGFLKLSGEVASFGVSPAVAIGAVVLGALLLVVTLADQDRGSAALVSFLVLAAGIAGLVFDDKPTSDFQVDGSTASLFVVLGAIAFLCSLVPWWSGRAYRTRRIER